MASELRVNTINSRTGFGTITVSSTGQDLVGITTIENLTTENTLVGAAASFTGNVQIGGVLTYEDVTNIDSVGLITARQGIEIGAKPGVGASISADGNMIVSGISTIVNLYVPDKIIHDGDTNNCIRFPAADTFTVETAGSERLRINSNGLFLLGHNTPIGNMGYGGSGIKTPPLQVVTADSTFNNGAAIINYRDGSGAAAIPAILRLALSRSDTKGGNGIVLNGDTVAAIQFQGNDGSNFRSVARIDANVDGAPGSDDMPGSLQFLTTSDGAYFSTRSRTVI